jgi:large subunit ribosomal protein L3
LLEEYEILVEIVDEARTLPPPDPSEATLHMPAIETLLALAEGRMLEALDLARYVIEETKKAGATGFYHYQEFRFADDAKLDAVAVGSVLSPEFVKEGDLVDLTSTSKGKGFQGGMKRFHMAGGFKSHGASVSHRSLGSIGNRADPAKCFKNKKMPGQMGHVKTTVQNVRVVRVDLENGLLLVHGSVPGPKSGIVTVRKAVKKMG